MVDITQNVKKHLIETKENKIRFLLEQKKVETIFLKIFESEQNLMNFHSLSEIKQQKIAMRFFYQLHVMSKNNLINEESGGFGDILQKIFKGFFPDVLETILEKVIYTLLGKLGLQGGFFHKFLTSFLATRPTELYAALKDCNALSALVAKAISEAIVMKIQEKFSKSGAFYDYLRNSLSDALSQQPFIDGLTKSLSVKVCEFFEDIVGNASDILFKQEDETSTTQPAGT
jgi:hypothetical protein